MEPLTPGPHPQPLSGSAAADMPLLEPGAWVGRFQVEALLGRGGMGAVYRVRDSVLERTVALKAIRFGSLGDPAILTRFRREAMALAQLNHRNVCQVHDWLEWGEGAFIAMEFIEGKTLAEAAPGLDLPAKLKVLRSIAQALEAAHAKGIVHRDLKPGNIMVTQEGQVKVLDFGLARFVAAGEGLTQSPDPDQVWPFPEEPSFTSIVPAAPGDHPTRVALDPGGTFAASEQGSLTELGAFLGSPAYASPEQIARFPVGPPSDIFALGIVAWELLLEEHPFPGKGAERQAAIVAGKHRSLRGRKVHPRLAALLRAMLVRNPSGRISAHRVVETLNRHLKPFPLAAWVAVIAASLLLGVGVAYPFLGRGIVADLVKDRPPRLVVLPIQNDTGDPALGPLAEVGMTELLATALRDSPSLTVVDGDAVGRALNTFRLEPGRPLEPEVQAQVLKVLGAPLYLQGTLSRGAKPGTLQFTYALKARSGQARHQGQVAVAQTGGFVAYALVDPAARDLLRKVSPLGPGPAHGAPPPAAAFASYATGKALFLKGDFKGSEPLLRDAAYQAPAFSMAVTAYASCLRRLGREQAAAVTNWAIMAARATGDRWAEGRAVGLQAYLARDRGDLEEAERLRKTTLALADTLHDLDGATVATNHLGLIAAERGQDQQAQAYYMQSLEQARQLADQSYIALAQNNLANLALKRGDLQGAAARYREVLQTQSSVGNRFGEALALNNLGVVALTTGNLADAETTLGRALAIRQTAGDRAGLATSLRNLGILWLMKGDLEQAQTRYEEALTAAQACGVRAIEAECAFCLGDLLRLRQRFRPAQVEYHKALDLLANGVTPEVRAGAEAGLAECDARLAKGRLKEALRQLDAMAPAFQDSPYVQRARAWIQFLAGNRTQALDTLGRAQADPKRTAPEIQGELAMMKRWFNRKPTEPLG